METVEDMEIGTDMALTDGVVINRAVTDMVTDKEMVVRRRKACHRATGACFECGEVGHLAKDCKKGSTSSGEKRFVSVRGWLTSWFDSWRVIDCDWYALLFVFIWVLGLISSRFILRVRVLVSVSISSR
nr:hypothetical protein [Tanacetum cinerariifolium]